MTDIISVEVDRRLCVLCAGPNDCVMAKREAGEEAEDPCWCVAQSFPDALTKKATKWMAERAAFAGAASRPAPEPVCA